MNRKELVEKLREWLGEDGINFFLSLQEKHGEDFGTAVWMEGRIPHPVHFREGMQVRNFLRQHVDWDAIRLDEEWSDLVREAIIRTDEL